MVIVKHKGASETYLDSSEGWLLYLDCVSNRELSCCAYFTHPDTHQPGAVSVYDSPTPQIILGHFFLMKLYKWNFGTALQYQVMREKSHGWIMSMSVTCSFYPVVVILRLICPKLLWITSITAAVLQLSAWSIGAIIYSNRVQWFYTECQRFSRISFQPNSTAADYTD